MTEPRRLCRTCFRQYVPPEVYKCPDCDPARRVTAPRQRPAPKLDLAQLPQPTEEDLDRYLREMP